MLCDHGKKQPVEPDGITGPGINGRAVRCTGNAEDSFSGKAGQKAAKEARLAGYIQEILCPLTRDSLQNWPLAGALR